MVICPLSSLDLHPPNIQTRLNFLRYGGTDPKNRIIPMGWDSLCTPLRGEGGWVVGKARGGKGFLALLSPSQLMSALLNSSQLRI